MVLNKNFLGREIKNFDMISAQNL